MAKILRVPRFSLRTLIIAMTLLCVALAICLWLWNGINSAREGARANECANNVFVWMMVLQFYHSQNGSFPPSYSVDSAGNPAHSWRVLVTPYREGQDFYDAYNFHAPWDDPANLRLADNFDTREWQCPSGPNYGRNRNTDYVAVVGPGTAFPNWERTSLADIKDGPENTIIIVEIANSDIHWTEPRDLNIEEMSFTINDRTRPSISSPHRWGAFVAFADGRLCSIRSHTPPDVVKALLTINGGEGISREELTKNGYLGCAPD